MSRKAFGISISVIAAVILALAGLNIGLEKEKTWDSEHPMANARISWEQTFRAGAWGSGAE